MDAASHPDTSCSERAPSGAAPAGPARIPADLAPVERALAMRFRSVSRVGADAQLRERILGEAAAAIGATSIRRAGFSEPEDVRRMWGWWTAAAAAVLLAIGVVAMQGKPGRAAASIAGATGSARSAVAQSATGSRGRMARATPARSTRVGDPRTGSSVRTDDMVVMDDPSLALFHDLETFDGLGLRPGDVLALGGR